MFCILKLWRCYGPKGAGLFWQQPVAKFGQQAVGQLYYSECKTARQDGRPRPDLDRSGCKIYLNLYYSVIYPRLLWDAVCPSDLSREMRRQAFRVLTL